MKCSDSPVIELPVGPSTLSFQQDNNSIHVGTSVWPCSLVLVKFLERFLLNSNPNLAHLLSDLPSKISVELGSGCGPAGLGLSDVILTDIAPVLPALRRNVKRNLPKSPKIHQLYWNNADQIRALKPPLDLVTCCLYGGLGLVACRCDGGVGWGEWGRAVLLGYQLRSPEAHRVFWEKRGRSRRCRRRSCIRSMRTRRRMCMYVHITSHVALATTLYSDSVQGHVTAFCFFKQKKMLKSSTERLSLRSPAQSASE